MKGVETARAATVKEGKTGGRGQHQAIAVSRYVSHVVGNQPLLSPQHLQLFAPSVKQNQTIRRRHSNSFFLRPGQNSVHAENMLIFYMRDAAEITVQQVQSVIEITDPKPATVIQRQ